MDEAEENALRHGGSEMVVSAGDLTTLKSLVPGVPGFHLCASIRPTRASSKHYCNRFIAWAAFEDNLAKVG